MWTPPTDNLYKFIALSGLALIGVPYVVVWLSADNLEKSTFETERQLVELKVDVEADKAATGRLKREASELKKMAADKQSSQKAVYEQTQNLLATQAEIAKRSHDLDRRVALLHVADKQHRSAVDTLKTLHEIARGLSLAGAFLAALGFSGWFYRVQRHEDQLLVYRVRAERLALESTERSRQGATAPTDAAGSATRDTFE